MPQNIVESATFSSPVQTVSNGDTGDASNFALAPQALANRTKYLNDSLTALAIGAPWATQGLSRRLTVASALDLVSIDTTTLTGGEIVGVLDSGGLPLGEYRWCPTLGAGTGDIYGQVYKPTAVLLANPGRWVNPSFMVLPQRRYTELHAMVQQSTTLGGASVASLGAAYALVTIGGVQYADSTIWDTAFGASGGPRGTYGITVRAVVDLAPTNNASVYLALRLYDQATPATNYILTERNVVAAGSGLAFQAVLEWSGDLAGFPGVNDPAVELIGYRSTHSCDVVGTSTFVVEGWRQLYI
jgi:hypothetical protein